MTNGRAQAIISLFFWHKHNTVIHFLEFKMHPFFFLFFKDLYSLQGHDFTLNSVTQMYHCLICRAAFSLKWTHKTGDAYSLS